MKKIYIILIFTTYLIGLSITTYAQNFAISGQIIDASMGEPLIGANVVEIDQNGRYLNATITDVNGNFIIKASSGNASIQISMLGFEKQLINANNRHRIDIKLKEESTQLADITVVGEKMGNDGVVAIRDRAIAVSRIEFKQLNSTMTTSVEEMLQGRMGNVDITTMSGDPGAGLNIRIRGTATINANNSPLIVINGIPYNTTIDAGFDFGSADVEKFGALIDVPPEDIESIEVLKDAGATAVWGARAANGVLLIKTKRGSQSKPVFDYTTKHTIGHEPDPIPMLDGGGYSKLIAESHYNLDERNNFFSSTNNRAWEIAYDKENEEYWNYAQNTDWLKEITQTAYTQQHHFSVRGGGEKSAYKVSLGYQDEQGTTKGTSLKKINIGTAFDYTISSKLKFYSDILYTRYDQDAKYDYEDWGGYVDNKSLRSMAIRKMPNLSVYVRDTNNVAYDEYFTPTETLQGNAADIPNPVAFSELGYHKRYKDNVRAGFTLKYNVNEKLTGSTIITLDVFDSKMEKYLPYKAIGFNFYDDITRKAINEFTNKSTIYNKSTLIYTPFESPIHDLKFLGQFDMEMTNQKGYKMQTSRGFSENDNTTIGEKPITFMEAWKSEFRSLGFFLNGFYKLHDKYIFSVSAKYEGNSKYSREARWGLFPSATFAWRISEEAFLSGISFINDFKLRGSWGITGNMPDDNYLYFNTYNAGIDYAYLNMPGVVPNNMELTSLQWERIEQTNLGFSFYAHKNRLNIEFDVYDKTTHDLFLYESNIPLSTGFEKFNTNNGSLQNKGIETSVDYRFIERKDFSASFNFNISHNKNVVLSLPENYASEYGNMLANGNYKTALIPGEATGGFFGYNYMGVYSTTEDTYVRDADGNLVYEIGSTTPMIMKMGGPSGYIFKAGDAIYQDRNHDGQINELDLVYLGDTNPYIMGGFGPRLQYKGLTFNMFIYFRLGYEIINQTRMDTEKMFNYDNQSTATNWRWRSEGDVTHMPRALHEEGFNWLGSSRFTEDGSHVRFKSASLTYSWPKNVASKIGLANIRTFITAYNLYTWTNYTGQDPEVGLPSRPDILPKDYSRTPPSIRYTLGLSITF